MKKILLIIFIITALIFSVIGIYKGINLVEKYGFSNIKTYVRVKIAQVFLKKYKLPPQKDTINIVAMTDSDYIMPLNVTMYSAIKNKHKDSKYHFYIIGVNLNDTDIEKLTKQSTKDAEITVISTKNIYDFYAAENSISWHVPNCDFLKLNFPEIFPKFDKILYLDADIIVQDDLSELYNINIDDYYAGCVQENFIYWPLEEELNLPKYFNNGVMLLNLKKMRKDNISEKMFKHRVFNCPKRFVTQDTYNVVLQPALKFIDAKYNIIILDLDVNKYSDINEYLKSGVIIHFAGGGKPWKDSEVIYASEWQKYYDGLQSEYGGIY